MNTATRTSSTARRSVPHADTAARPASDRRRVRPAAGTPAAPTARRAPDFRRRRLVAATVVLAALAFIVFTFVAGRASADGEAVEGPLRPPSVYVVQRGDSLWSIVQALAPERDPRPLVASLKRAAGGADLKVGQRILLPPALAGA